MADLFMWVQINRRAVRRERIFRDRTHPLEVFNDAQVFQSFRFPRHIIFELAREIRADIDFPVTRGAITTVLQVCLALKFYATGSFHNVVGGLIGVDKTTANRAITRVTDALHRRVGHWINLPPQVEADQQKRKFYAMRGLPNVIECVDGTHIRIEDPPSWDGQEHYFVNRKRYHSLNVQVICDADLKFTNVVARWPGSVHDARILRNSPLFTAFEGNQPPLDGILLGDSGHMIRTWLMTPIMNPANPPEVRYNIAHRSTRCTVERAIGVAKKRWYCLRCGLRLTPQKASRVIMVCFMLHNRARHLNLPPPPDDQVEEEDAGDNHYDARQHRNERARTAAGQRVRQRIIAENFINDI